VPVPYLDRVIAEVADVLARQFGMDSKGLTLTRHQALSLARATVARLVTIRDRDGTDPLPGRNLPAAAPGYDPCKDLAMLVIDAQASPDSPRRRISLGHLRDGLGLDGLPDLPGVAAAIRAAVKGT
jgi:hypothetical protein